MLAEYARRSGTTMALPQIKVSVRRMAPRCSAMNEKTPRVPISTGEGQTACKRQLAVVI